MQQTKLIFVVQEDLDGGFIAKALEVPILVESPTLERLRRDVKMAVNTHYQGQERPELLHLHFVRDEFIPLG